MTGTVKISMELISLKRKYIQIGKMIIIVKRRGPGGKNKWS